MRARKAFRGHAHLAHQTAKTIVRANELWCWHRVLTISILAGILKVSGLGSLVGKGTIPFLGSHLMRLIAEVSNGCGGIFTSNHTGCMRCGCVTVQTSFLREHLPV